jgi:hypothetical protein
MSIPQSPWKNFRLNLSADGETVGADQRTRARDQPINVWLVFAAETAGGS